MLSAVGHHELGIFGTFFLGNLVVGGKLADDDGQVVGVGIRYHDIEFCSKSILEVFRPYRHVAFIQVYRHPCKFGW